MPAAHVLRASPRALDDEAHLLVRPLGARVRLEDVELDALEVHVVEAEAAERANGVGAQALVPVGLTQPDAQDGGPRRGLDREEGTAADRRPIAHPLDHEDRSRRILLHHVEERLIARHRAAASPCRGAPRRRGRRSGRSTSGCRRARAPAAGPADPAGRERALPPDADALIIINPDDYTMNIDANKASLEQLKSQKEELIGKTCYEVTHHNQMPCASSQDACPMKETMKTGKPSAIIHQHFDKNNKPMNVEVAIHPVKNKDGKIVQIIHISKEITECNSIAKEKTKESDEVNKILDGIGDLLFVMDKDRVITRVNKRTCEVFKKKPEEFIGKHCHEVVHGTNEPWPNCPAGKTFKTELTATVEINDPKIGSPLLVTTSPILNEKENLLIAYILQKTLLNSRKLKKH